MIKTVKKSQNSNWFMDLLLDETICAGTVAVPREMVRLAGGVNKRLGAKQKYELLLRIAAERETRYVITYSRSLRNSSERLLNAGESGFFISIRKNTIRVKLSSLREGILRR